MTKGNNMNYPDYESADIGYVGYGESDEGASYDDYAEDEE
jgi:hypothetical protein